MGLMDGWAWFLNRSSNQNVKSGGPETLPFGMLLILSSGLKRVDGLDF